MHCTNCGKEINKNDKYCAICGSKTTTHVRSSKDDSSSVDSPIESKFLGDFSIGYYVLSIFYLSAMKLRAIEWLKYLLLPPVIYFAVNLVVYMLADYGGFPISTHDPIISLVQVLLGLTIYYPFARTVRKLAYVRRDWDSFDDFRKDQRIWDNWGIAAFFFIPAIVALIVAGVIR